MSESMESLKKHMHVLCDRIGERHMGSEGAKKAVEYISGEFKRYGYEAVCEEFDAPGWTYGKYSLSMAGTGRKLSCFPCYFSNPCNLEGKLLEIKLYKQEDVRSMNVRGKICFYNEATEVGGVFRRNKFAEELDRMGASALIVISNYYDTENSKIIRTSKLKKLAVMTVSRNTAVEIAKNLHRRFRIVIEAKNFKTKSVNVVGRLQGSKNKKVVIGAHYDTAPGIPAASDNTAGTVIMMELARILRNRNNGYSMDFVAFSGEEYGEAEGKYPIGSYAYVKLHKAELKQISWMWSVDGNGSFWDKGVFNIGNSKRIKEIISKIVPGIPIKGFLDGSDNNVFHVKGIPNIWYFCRSYTDYIQVHSPKDNLDIISYGELNKVCMMSYDIIKTLLAEY